MTLLHCLILARCEFEFDPPAEREPRSYYRCYEKQLGICKYSQAYYGKSARIFKAKGIAEMYGFHCMLVRIGLRYWEAENMLA